MVENMTTELSDKNLVWDAANSVMAYAKPKASPGWSVLYYLAFLVLIGSVVAYGFFTRQTQTNQQKTSIKKEAIIKIDNDISAAENNADYRKYMWAKVVYDLSKTQQGWGDRLSRIIMVFEDLQKLWWDAVTFSDFSLDFSSLRLKWTVSDLKVVYWSGWVVDKFNSLEFIKDITITDYKKTDYGFAFSLVAQIVLDNVKR